MNEAGYLRITLDTFFKHFPTSKKSDQIRTIKAIHKKEIRDGEIFTANLYKLDNDFCVTFTHENIEFYEAKFDFY